VGVEVGVWVVLTNDEDERVIETSMHIVYERGVTRPVLLGDGNLIQERLRSLNPRATIQPVILENGLIEESAALYQEKTASINIRWGFEGNGELSKGKGQFVKSNGTRLSGRCSG
jgi:hypothetical protein